MHIYIYIYIFKIEHTTIHDSYNVQLLHLLIWNSFVLLECRATGSLLCKFCNAIRGQPLLGQCLAKGASWKGGLFSGHIILE